jgi:trans-aconitate methyltransferase
MDLDSLEFDNDTFDVATSSFGLFFLEDMTRSLQNIADTVKPKGKVAITSFTGEAFSPMSDIFLKHYQEAGKEIPPLSWKRLATKELLAEQFNAVGITNIDIYHEPLGYQMTSAQMWWDVVWNAGYRSLLNQLTDQQQVTFKEKHMKEISELVGDGVWFNTEVMIAVGIK